VDGTFSPADNAFRLEVRDWLHDNVPRGARPYEPVDARAFDLGWQRTMFDGDWAGISWPTEYGGRGLSLIQQMIWHEEYARARAPYVGVNFVGLNHAGPTLIMNGTDAQKATHLPRVLRGEVVWCQGFSEPGSGSDLASLRTRAVIDGDHLVVNGQKVWTSFGDVADFQELLVRTDPAATKHKGITWVICDMRTPGITVRPIVTMAGTRDFCEVFYDEVRIPIANVVGGLGEGWRVANSTLSFERGTAYLSQQIDLARTLESLIELAGEWTGPGYRPLIVDDEFSRRIAEVRAQVTAMRAMSYASVSRAATQAQPGPEGSIIRLYFTQLQQSVYRLAMDMLGHRQLKVGAAGSWPYYYLYSFSRTIAGGSQEIQRNIIGERVLGLPRGARQ